MKSLFPSASHHKRVREMFDLPLVVLWYFERCSRAQARRLAACSPLVQSSTSAGQPVSVQLCDLSRTAVFSVVS